MDLWLLLPEFIVLFTAFAIWALDWFTPEHRKPQLGWLAALGVLVAAGFTFPLWGRNQDILLDLLRIDDFAVFFKLLFLGMVFFVVSASPAYARRNLRHVGEYYGIALVTVAGAMFLASSRELITAYISLELVSFGFYALASYAKFDLRSSEAGAKYIILGALSSAILLYGLSLVFGAVQTTHFDLIAERIAAARDLGPLVPVGLAMVVAGLGFKVAAVPFHLWTPDVYEGAPLPITAYISVASKTAGFVLLLRLFAEAFAPVADDWRVAIGVLAVLSMTIGNLVAMHQSNIKRLLAYSSIAQSGYVLVGAAILTGPTSTGMMLQLTAFTVTNLAAFLTAVYFHNVTGGETLDDYAGLARRHLPMALSLTVALFSLAGLPLFAGFVTKFYLFQAVAQTGMWWLVAFAIGNSIVSVYYYLRPVRAMFVVEPKDPGRLSVPLDARLIMAVLVGAVIWLGVYPGPLVSVAETAARSLIGG